MKKTIDLHIHTYYSDGSLSPFEIIDKAKEYGLDTISIADHDTIEAYSKKLINYAQKQNINLITGIEISTKNKKAGIHILGYNIDIHNKDFNNKINKIRNARHNYLFDVASKLKKLGYIINTDKLDKIEVVTKAHIASDIINNTSNQEILIKTFNHIPTKGEFIETIMNEGCPAYVKKESISPKDAAELIRSAGGKVVIAHPVAYTYEDNLTNNDIEEIIKETNADGIEAYYIYIDNHNNKHNDINRWVKFAKKNNVFTTIGSDFHNEDGLHPIIGLLNEDIIIPEKETNKILTNIKKKK